MAKRTRKPAIPSSEPDDGTDAPIVGDTGHANVVADSGGASGPTVIDPAGIGSGGNGDDGNDGQPRKRGRGRPPGSGAGKTKQVPLNVNGLEKLLVGIHATLAMLASAPELALDTASADFDGKTEAQFLASSIKDVANHYHVEWMDQKSIDWLNLIQCCVIVYGGRFYAIRSRMRTSTPVAPKVVNEAPRPSNVNGANVTNIPGVGPVQFPSDHPMAVDRQH